MLRIIVLGAGAGGGCPQWNCNCPNCRRARAGQPGVKPLTQSSLAVSADGGATWCLLNASPDLRQQMLATPALHPAASPNGMRDSPVAAVVLTNADVDHVAGLLTMREGQPFVIHGTRRVLGIVKANPIFNVLDGQLVRMRPLDLEAVTAIEGPDGRPTGLSVRPFVVPGKTALWMEDRRLADFGTVAEDTVGLELTDGAGSLFYIPGCASLPQDLAARLQGAALLFFDGTTYTDDEMIRLGLGTKTGARMGHISMSGPAGSIAAFSRLDVARKIFIHINNSNPVLDQDSAERTAVAAAGWELAVDGMEVRL